MCKAQFISILLYSTQKTVDRSRACSFGISTQMALQRPGVLTSVFVLWLPANLSAPGQHLGPWYILNR